MEINDLISYCSNKYLKSDKEYKCQKCRNDCKGSCEECLKDIHFGNNRRYDCENIINYYVCKYTYKYSSEIGKIFFENPIIDKVKKIKIASIGCGPCTDLIGVNEYINQKQLDIKLIYTGIDLNEGWKDIHNFIKQNGGNIEANFVYKNVFNVFKDLNKENKYAIVFLQYLLSDMIKYNSEEEMNEFIKNLVSKVISYMEENSLIIINDINHYKARKYFDMVLSEMKQQGIKYKYKKKHYNNNMREKHFNYGKEYQSNSLMYNIPINIQLNYNPWSFCSSAQLIIQRKV